MSNLTVSFKFTLDSPGCHGNKIWDKVGYSSASVRDIYEIFVSIGEFSGLGHRILRTRFFPQWHPLPWQRN